MQSAVLPLASAKTPPFLATVQPRDRAADSAASSSRPLQVFPTGDGEFTADADGSMVIAEGDIVRLMDPPPAWPETAQAMVVGVVRSVRPKDSEPLRNIVIIRPRFQLSQISSMVLKIEESSASSDVSPPSREQR
jgi:hypothetical protein